MKGWWREGVVCVYRKWFNLIFQSSRFLLSNWCNDKLQRSAVSTFTCSAVPKFDGLKLDFLSVSDVYQLIEGSVLDHKAHTEVVPSL